ncbi:MAG: HDIG domain-containing protein [Candidatus Thermoplasmatota archaeon]|nr:HDIG domain-containing protein [Candidatus Thermoplasmatota archaeon]
MIGKKDIEELFGSLLSRISDNELRSSVVDVWVKACKRGGWETVEELKNIPFTLLTDSRGIDLIEHTIVVTWGALALGKAQTENYAEIPYKINFDRLIAGGLLHDVGKLLEITSDGKGNYRKSRAGQCARHPISGAILAAESGLSDEIVNIIACHAKEGEGRPQVIETVLIHQADFSTFNPLVMLQKNQLILEE